MVKNPLNENKKTMMYPPCKAALRRIMSKTVVAVFIVATAVTVLAIYRCGQVLVVDYEVKPATSQSIVSVLFSIQITVFQLIWDNLSKLLVKATNPRTEEDAKDLSVQFLFPFSFVSTYANILFH